MCGTKQQDFHGVEEFSTCRKVNLFAFLSSWHPVSKYAHFQWGSAAVAALSSAGMGFGDISNGSTNVSLPFVTETFLQEHKAHSMADLTTGSAYGSS